MAKLTNLIVDEVSFCRAGMNKHARVALFKSADKPQGPQAIAKATFQEALDAQLVSQRVQNAFYGCFDNLWSRNDAFRTAMTDEIAAGGDGSVAADAWVESVKALADNAVAAAKENGGKPTDEELSGAMEKAVATYLSKQEQTDMTITTKAALLAAVAKFDPTKSTVGELAEIHKAATDLNLESELPVSGPLALVKAADNSVLMREIDILKMAPDIRTHFEALATAGQTTFLAKSSADRKTEVEAKNATDPVVHKCLDGTEIRKSDGATVLALAKRNDELAAKVETLTTENAGSAIEKAMARFPNVAKGTVTTVMKAATTPEEKAEAEQSLTAMNKALAGAFRRAGSAGPVADIEKGADTPEGQMSVIVKRIAKEKNISEAFATVEALNDPEYAALYTESLADIPAVSAYAPTA